MLTFWFFALGVPLTVLGGFGLFAPARAAAFAVAFPRMRRTGNVLCVIGWFWTAWELDTIGIEVFDRYLRRAPFDVCGINGELVILATVLSVLTIRWMPNLLPLRGLAAILMLYPARLFPTVRLEPSVWRLLPVTVAYLSAILGMFTMFYPWRIRQALAFLGKDGRMFRAVSAVLVATGLALLACGFAA